MPTTDLSLTAAFAGLDDPRRDHNKLHPLTDLLAVALCATLCGAQSWPQVVTFAQAKQAWLRRFLSLPNGIPSHDTFNRVFGLLDPRKFQECFAAWMAAACQATGLKPIAIDGKAVRAARRGTANGCLTVVTAWATENGVALGQVAVEDLSNEQAAIPELLKALDLAGAIVTIDAAGCQKEVARLVTEAGGDYVLALKDNQPTLREAVAQRFQDVIEGGPGQRDYDCYTEESKPAHGRQETRTCEVIRGVAGLPGQHLWPGLTAIAVVVRICQAAGQLTDEVRYFISSARVSAAEMLRLVRGHWSIENQLHWVLDVAFREDANKARAGHAGENLAWLRRVGLSLLKKAPGGESIQTKRLKAGWDEDFLLAILRDFTGK
jgi:predicted transposase YbfD/YdcC